MGFVAEPSSKKAKRQEMSDYLSVSDNDDDDDDDDNLQVRFHKGE